MDYELFELAFKIMGILILLGGISIGVVLALLVNLWRKK